MDTLFRIPQDITPPNPHDDSQLANAIRALDALCDGYVQQRRTTSVNLGGLTLVDLFRQMDALCNGMDATIPKSKTSE